MTSVCFCACCDLKRELDCKREHTRPLHDHIDLDFPLMMPRHACPLLPSPSVSSLSYLPPQDHVLYNFYDLLLLTTAEHALLSSI